MNDVTREQKDQVLKSMAIIGFIAVIIFGVWLAVQIVSLMPSAFSSLASIADGVYNYQPTEETETPVVIVDEQEDADDVVVLSPEDFPPENDIVVIDETDDEVIDAEDDEDVTPSTPTTPTPVTPQPPRVIEEVVYEVPTSNPNGYTDLMTRIVAVGYLNSNGNFVKGSRIDNDTRGAFQFEVKNIGTKTSNDWDFTATLTSGTKYDAPTQLPLKPQEGVIFTLGYDNVGEGGIQTIGVTLKTSGDTNTANNSFTWAVSVVE